MTTTDRADLVAVVRAARDALAADLDDAYLAEVVAAEADNPDDPEAAMRAVEAAVTRALPRAAG